MKLTPAVLALLVGCTDVPEQTTLTSYAYGMGDCPNSDCGMNTGTVNGVYFSNLNFTKLPNESGVVLDGFVSLPPGTMRIDVVGSRFVAYDFANLPRPPLVGLVNAEFNLIINKERYGLVLQDVHFSDGSVWWAAPDSTRLETYTFRYRHIATESIATHELCRSTLIAGDLLKLDAVVFKGEIYESDTKQRVVPPPAERWFNIACMGSGVAKEFMMRHTQASKPILDNTTPAERQTLMNAWTANYCGDGVAFTHTGTKLRMRDNKKWIHPASGWSWEYDIGHVPVGEDPQLSSYEAIWNEYGAVCLNTPRLESKEPGIRDDIIEHCEEVGHPIDYCTDDGLLPVGWEAQGHILTANPAPPPIVVLPPILIAP